MRNSTIGLNNQSVDFFVFFDYNSYMITQIDFNVGDIVRVKLLHTDVLQGFIDFAQAAVIKPATSKSR